MLLSVSRHREGTGEQAQTLWEAVESLMLVRGWNSAELSRVSEVAPPVLSRWRRGESYPTQSTQRAVAEALGVTVADLQAISVGSVPEKKTPGSILPLSPKETAVLLAYRDNERFKRLVNALFTELRTEGKRAT